MPETVTVPGEASGSAGRANAPARVSAEDVAVLIRSGSYPVSLPVLVGVRNFHTYPSVELQEDSRNLVTDPLLDTETASFTASIYARMTRGPGAETALLDRMQAEITRVLAGAHLSGSAVISETSNWRRRHVPKPYSIVASLSFSVRRLFAWEQDTGVGAGSRMAVAGRDFRLVNDHVSMRGIEHAQKINDAASQRVVIRGAPKASRSAIYPYKPDDYAWIQQAIDFGAPVPVEFRAPGRPVERLSAVLVGQQARVNYSGAATVVLTMEEEVGL